MEKRSKGLLKFVNAYKDFARTPDLKISEFNLKETIERLLTLLQPDLERNRITIDLDIKSQKLNLKADHELIEQVLINLLKNAIEALSDTENSKINITANQFARLGKVKVNIEDNGPGIPTERLDKIFIPFYTIKKEGTGVGLSFARQIMKLHNGSITVQSERDQGTIFTLEF